MSESWDDMFVGAAGSVLGSTIPGFRRCARSLRVARMQEETDATESIRIRLSTGPSPQDRSRVYLLSPLTASASGLGIASATFGSSCSHSCRTPLRQPCVRRYPSDC